MKNGEKKKGGCLKYLLIICFAFLALITLISIAAGGGESKASNDIQQASTENKNTEEANISESIPDTAEQEENPDIPIEYQSALTSAESYSALMHMSKQGIYDQLTSEYGDQFSAEAAQYAIDNIDADWNDNALQSAKSYSDNMHMSKQGIYDQLISEHGEKFTEEEAQYAVDNLEADYKNNALQTAISYQENMSMSPEAIRDQLTSDHGEKFTQEEADYAIENLPK